MIDLTGEIGVLRTASVRRDNRIDISFKAPSLGFTDKDGILVDLDQDKIIIRKPGIMESPRYHINKLLSGWYKFTVCYREVPICLRIFADKEESNGDRLVFYFEDNTNERY